MHRDPCERAETDVFAHLSSQERENVTYSAQEMVRKIHYRYMVPGTGTTQLGLYAVALGWSRCVCGVEYKKSSVYFGF